MKLPKNAIMKDANIGGLKRTIIKIPGMLGWDIAGLIAKESNVDVIELAKTVSLGVYQDHVIVDTDEIEAM